jgi:MFS family permease
MASLLMEIPTGAFADMMGKKKTLMLAFLLQGLGNILMGTANSFWMLALSLWLLVCVGGAFYSGTLDALVFDSLKVMKEEDSFDKKISIISATRLWSMAICSVVGGFAFYVFPGFPFILNGVVCLLGLVACFFLTEPAIDTEKYSFSTFFKQNTMGIRSLFTGVYMKRLSLYLAVTGAFTLVIYNLLDDLLAVEFGYSPMQISILFAAACLVAGFASIYIPKIKFAVDQKTLLIVSMIIMGMLLMLSPIVGMIGFGLILFLRVIMEVVYDNSTSVAINKHIESKVRATTLSTLSLLRSLPYAICGTFAGAVIQMSGGARNFSVWYGLALIVLVLLFGMRMEKEKAT